MKIGKKRLGILCSKIRLEEKLLFEEFEKLNSQIIQINPQNLFLKGGNEDFGRIDLLLNREIAQTRAELILEFANNTGVKTINSSYATKLCNNKALTTNVLKKASIPVPKTIIVFSIDEALKMAQELGYPLVVKPLWGSWGRLLSKVDTAEALEAVLEHKQAFNNPQQSIFYLQEYIEKPDRDIRVFVVGGKPITAMYRTSKHWLTNTAKGAVPKSMKLNKEINDLVIKAVNALNVEIAGVDIVESKDGYLVLEVNATPEFHGSAQVANVNIPQLIAQYVLKEEINVKN